MVEHSKVINEQKLGVMARETFGREPYGVQNHTQLHSFELFFWILAKGYENFTSFMNVLLSPLHGMPFFLQVPTISMQSIPVILIDCNYEKLIYSPNCYGDSARSVADTSSSRGRF